jgi:predicted methyltransferase
MRQFFPRTLTACALIAAFACSASAHAADDGLEAAIAGSQRSAANMARDPSRHPLETLRFFGIAPTMTVVELIPGGGWYTEILAPYLKPRGHLIAAGDDPASTDAYASKSGQRMLKKFASAPELFGKVEATVFDPPSKMAFAPAGSVDMVLTFRNIHNWIAEVDEPALKKTFAAIYTSLKPGGVFGVVEHRLPETMTQDAKASTGYVHPSFVIKLAEGAGFKLAAQSEINANPKDKAAHPKGVWALPPTFANGDTDRSRFAAIGESDRMTLKFVKPK